MRKLSLNKTPLFIEEFSVFKYLRSILIPNGQMEIAARMAATRGDFLQESG